MYFSTLSAVEDILEAWSSIKLDIRPLYQWTGRMQPEDDDMLQRVTMDLHTLAAAVVAQQGVRVH